MGYLDVGVEQPSDDAHQDDDCHTRQNVVDETEVDEPEQNRTKRCGNACKEFFDFSLFGVDVEVDQAAQTGDDVADGEGGGDDERQPLHTAVNGLEDQEDRDQHEGEKVGEGVELDAELVGEVVFAGDLPVKDVKRAADPREDDRYEKVVLGYEVGGKQTAGDIDHRKKVGEIEVGSGGKKEAHQEKTLCFFDDYSAKEHFIRDIDSYYHY